MVWSRVRRSWLFCGQKGFSLIEIIVIVAIFLVLSAIVVPLLLNQIGKAQESRALSDVASVADVVRGSVSLGDDLLVSGMTISSAGTTLTVGGRIEVPVPPDANGKFCVQIIDDGGVTVHYDTETGSGLGTCAGSLPPPVP